MPLIDWARIVRDVLTTGHLVPRVLAGRLGTDYRHLDRVRLDLDLPHPTVQARLRSIAAELGIEVPPDHVPTDDELLDDLRTSPPVSRSGMPVAMNPRAVLPPPMHTSANPLDVLDEAPPASSREVPAESPSRNMHRDRGSRTTTAVPGPTSGSHSSTSSEVEKQEPPDGLAPPWDQNPRAPYHPCSTGAPPHRGRPVAPPTPATPAGEESPMAMKFCDTLKAERRRAGLSQNAVGKQLGVSGVTISNWEAGRYQPSNFVELIAKLRALPDTSGDAPPVRRSRMPAAANGGHPPATRARRTRSTTANGASVPAVVTAPAGDESPTDAIIRLAGELTEIEAAKRAKLTELGAAVAAAARGAR